MCDLSWIVARPAPGGASRGRRTGMVKRRGWKGAGVFFWLQIAAAGGFLSACSDGTGSLSQAIQDNHEGDVTVTADGTNLTCPAASACFNVASPKHNITHLFVKVGFDGCAPAPYTIEV